jgi:hypothetical protein
VSSIGKAVTLGGAEAIQTIPNGYYSHGKQRHTIQTFKSSGQSGVCTLHTAAIEFPNSFGWAGATHYNRLKVRLREFDLLEAFDFQNFDCMVREIVAPEVFVHMISRYVVSQVNLKGPGEIGPTCLSPP